MHIFIFLFIRGQIDQKRPCAPQGTLHANKEMNIDRVGTGLLNGPPPAAKGSFPPAGSVRLGVRGVPYGCNDLRTVGDAGPCGCNGWRTVGGAGPCGCNDWRTVGGAGLYGCNDLRTVGDAGPYGSQKKGQVSLPFCVGWFGAVWFKRPAAAYRDLFPALGVAEVAVEAGVVGVIVFRVEGILGDAEGVTEALVMDHLAGAEETDGVAHVGVIH